MSKEATARSAMKLALEALELAKRSHGMMLLSDPPQEAWKTYRVDDSLNRAITVLREALTSVPDWASEAKEQPAPVAKPHEQEPVAHRDDFWCADLTCKKCYSADFRFKHKNSVVNESLTTPAQRTWVGLTDEEIYSVLENLQVMHHRPPTTDSRVIFARAIEAKLRSKNEDRN